MGENILWCCTLLCQSEWSLTHCFWFFPDFLVPQDSLMTSKKKEGSIILRNNYNNKTKPCLLPL